MARSLIEWVEYIQTLHARTIDLSLERVAEVFGRLFPDGVPYRVVTIAGTNGKGSTAEIIASIYRCAGYKTGKYTSPHLVRFNERFNINGQSVDDMALLQAFERVEAVRGQVSLTFFEYGTLLAIELFAQADLDIAIMEVGLGGRLDAVNVLEPDATVITSIALDHTAWLGNTTEQILFEKFGVTREDTPCVIAMQSPPANLHELATNKGVPLWCAGRDYHYKVEEGQTANGWHYLPGNGDGWSGEQLANLPLPFGQAGHQLQNAAAAITAVQLLQASFKVTHESLVKGLELARNPGRCQVISRQPTVIIDVAHNAASVEALRQFVESLDVQGRVIAVCGMLRDKEIAAALGEISPIINAWHLASIDSERGTTAAEIAEFVDDLDCAAQCPDVLLYENAWEAFMAAEVSLTENDCLVVFGSFFISGDIIAHLQKRDKND